MLVNMIYRIRHYFPEISDSVFTDIIKRYYIRKNSKKGVNKRNRKRKLIVSLTSIPSRIDTTWIAIESILRQQYKPDKIILWLGKEQFRGVKLPQRLVGQQERGLEIRFCEDIGPYTKVIYALEEFPNDFIVTVDDDIIYAESMVKVLIEACAQNNGKCICAHRTHLVKLKKDGTPVRYNNWIWYPQRQQSGNNKGTIPGKTNFLTGVGGVLYPPYSLYKDVLRKELFLKLSPKADDIWLYIMALLNGTDIVNAKGIYGNILSIDCEDTKKVALMKQNVGRGRNDEYLKNVLKYYNLDLKKAFESCNR